MMAFVLKKLSIFNAEGAQMNNAYAQRIANLKASEIREILKVTEQPSVISFAGGLPAPELFPIEAISNMCASVLACDGQRALQYATTEGYVPLRRWIAARMNTTLGTALDEDNILITNGSQQGLDLSGKVFIDEGDVVLCESPTYLAAITAFRAYGCNFVEVPTDEEGMNMDDLDRLLKITYRVKGIYVIPNFQNPTGRTMSLERRERLAKLAAQHRVMVFEDNPYGELRFEGKYLPSVQSFDKEGWVISFGSFSKILCPGFRIGWVAGDKDIVRKYVLVKQGVDLQSNTFVQAVIAAYLEQHDIDEHIKTILDVYKTRRDVLLSALDRLFPQGVQHTRPEGGLFAWVTLPESLNARHILDDCVARKVAFVPGGPFFPNGGHENTLRLNFSNMEENRIEEGIVIMADVLNRHLKMV